MASQFVPCQQIKWIAATLPVFVRLAGLLGQPNETFCAFTFLGGAVTRALGFLPVVIAVVAPALINLPSDPYCVSICVIRFVYSCWSLLHLLTRFA